MDTGVNVPRGTGDDGGPTTEGVIAPARRARLHLAAAEEGRQHPCTPGQQRIWQRHQLNPRDPLLTMVVRWRLDGAMANAELERAFRMILARHEALRTRFLETAGEVVQIVEPHVSFRISFIDLTALPEAEALAETERAAHLEARTAFDLSVPPLIRVTHARLRTDSSILLVTLHRIVSDSRSIGIVARELSAIGAALNAGRVPVLPDLPVRYGDCVAAHAAQPAGPIRHTDAEYWQRALDGVKHFEILPDHARPPAPGTNGAAVSIALDRVLTGKLECLGSGSGATLRDTFLTALLCLLHRYTGETDIAIGGELAGRDPIGIENVIGLFSDTLVVRGDLSGDPGFLTLLARIRVHLAEIQQHRHMARAQLLEFAMGKPGPGGDLPCAVNFRLRQSTVNREDHTAFQLTELPTCVAAAACDLDFSMIEGPEGWRASCEFNGDLFDEQTIARLLGHFRTLLHTLATGGPTRNISNLAILDDAERLELVVGNNRTSVEYQERLPLPQLFEAQAARSPEAIAVVCGELSMNYRELDIASNRLAHELRSRGVEPGSRVAVFLERSPDMVVALLAILKSGSAYVPLDPAYPAERLQYAFNDSRPAAIITQASLCGRLVQEAVLAIVVDAQSASIASQATESLPATATLADPAYVIYTSGSTGRPKGVEIPHGALINLLCAMRDRPGLASRDTVVSVTTICFDLSVPDLFLPIIVGAKLVLARGQETADGAGLLGLLRRHGATFMQATPVTWQLLLEAGWHGDPPLRMLCGGESMPRRLADRLLECGGELWNMYGPTETTVWSSMLRVEPGNGPVLIGPPIANTQFYILDSHQQLVPHGVPGELVIGGAGVALGYFGLPEATAGKFIPDGFRDPAGAKLYRTGDIVRMRRGGNMEFLGRMDRQIKLRGFRVELGEIEATLLRHPDVADAVAVLAKDASGEGAIWAYVVLQRHAAGSSDILIAALRACVAQFLPGYMRPSTIVVLDELPRTPNGKIDRRSLPAPVQHESREPTQPLNEIERRVAEIWSSVLGSESSGSGVIAPGIFDKHANFLDLGGHSLAAARLLARFEAVFGRRLSLLALFEAPTIEGQAKLLMHGDQREYDFRQVVALQPHGSKPPLIAIHNTGVYYYNLSRSLGPDQPVTALQLFDPAVARQDFPRTLEEIAAEYVQLIFRFHAAGPYALIGWCVGGVLAFEVARQLVAAGHQVSLLAMIDAWAPGHSRRLSWWRAILAEYSYRWQLIGADWRKVVSREQTLAAFLARRVLARRLLRGFGGVEADAQVPVSFLTRELSAENYDQWLLGYLEEIAESYEPGPYPGKVTLLCSTREPRGLFLDPQMGWGGFALAGVEVAVIDGDHFTVFRGAGLEQMAAQIARAASADQTG